MYCVSSMKLNYPILLYFTLLFVPRLALANQPEPCDPAKVLTAGTCVKCHAAETEVWKGTAHFRTFEQLHRSSQAKEIAQKMGISSIKRSNVCVQCHYTQQVQEGATRVVSGISCESCHGAAKDWIFLHNDYGGLGITKETESATHREERLRTSITNGMRNPHNLYLIARSCLACHTVPHEKLVNVGGHVAGSAEFDFVAWSQGKIKHNFYSHNGKNIVSSPERLRLMYLVGLVAELEFSTRATAQATEKGNYGITVAKRAAETSQQLFTIQQTLRHPLLEELLTAFASAELSTNNSSELNQVADRIRQAGERLADQLQGRDLSFLDAQIPPANKYK